MIRISSFAVTTLISLVIICFSITGTVFGQAKNYEKHALRVSQVIAAVAKYKLACIRLVARVNQNKIQDAYRDEMEEDYMEEVQILLESKSLYHSGITMTKIMYEDGLITYRMVIHNQSIDRMSYYEKQQLLKELQKVDFPDANSIISHQFLEIQQIV